MSVSFYVGGVLFQNGDTLTPADLPAASTTVAGISQLNNTTSSTSTAQAATANAVKVVYDAVVAAQSTATAALPKAGGTMTGYIVFNSGQTFPNPASVSPPATPVTGNLWYDTNAPATLKVYNGTAWVPTASAASSSTAPASPTTGTTWYDTGVTPALLKVWNGSAWVSVPDTATSTAPTSPATGQVWNDTNSTPAVLKTWDGSAWVPQSTTVGTTAPSSPVLGQLWSDTNSTPAVSKVWNGTSWVPQSTTVGTTAPSSPVTGQLWSDTNTTPATLQTWNGSAWVPVQAAGGGTVTSVDGSGGTTGLTLSGGPITTSGTLTLGGTLAVANGGTGATSASGALTSLGALPLAGGTMTGGITFSDAGEGLIFSDASSITGISGSTSSSNTTVAASSAAVKAAYDAAVAAQNNGPLTSDTVLYVNCTDGNDLTAARGTDRPYATITAALAAASEGDTILLSPGTFTESFTISKGVNISGTFSDQATWSGTKIIGNVVVNLVGAGVIRNLAVSDIYFISANSTSPVSITGMSPGAGGINTFTSCTFTQQLVTDTAQFAFQTSGTWTRSVYLRGCTLDGNFKHNAGTAAGASGYVVIDALQGVGNNNMYHYILTGTVEYRNPSNTLASILQTGGVTLINNASSGITANGAATSAVFGGTGFSYKGTAAAAGAGTVYFQGGSNQGTGKVDIGANVIYGWTNLSIDPANLTVNGAAIAYTTAVPSAANAQSLTQQRPRLDLLKSTSSVVAANQLATVIDSATGAIYSVAAMDAGTY